MMLSVGDSAIWRDPETGEPVKVKVNRMIDQGAGVWPTVTIYAEERAGGVKVFREVSGGELEPLPSENDARLIEVYHRVAVDRDDQDRLASGGWIKAAFEGGGFDVRCDIQTGVLSIILVSNGAPVDIWAHGEWGRVSVNGI